VLEWVFEELLLEELPVEWVADAVLRSGVLAGAGFAAGAEAAVPVSALSEDLAFLDLLFFVVLASTPAVVSAVEDLLAAALSEASPLLLFFERLFLVVLVSALAALSLLPAPALSAASGDFLERLFFFAVVASAVLAAELSAASAVFFFDRLFLAGAAESSGAAVSALAVAFFFDFDFGVFVESALASALLCVASAAAFFLLFFLVAVLLLSLWSVEPACCAPRVATPPQISNIAAISAKTTLLLDLIGAPVSPLGFAYGPGTLPANVCGRVGVAPGMPCGNSSVECAHHPGETR
jgi:hypothetical protein